MGRGSRANVGQRPNPPASRPVSVDFLPFLWEYVIQGHTASMSPTPGTLSALHWAGPKDGLLDTARLLHPLR